MGNKKDYICRECGYKFKNIKQTADGLKCPYCGSPKTEKYEPTTADDLLNSVE